MNKITQKKTKKVQNLLYPDAIKSTISQETDQLKVPTSPQTQFSQTQGNFFQRSQSQQTQFTKVAKDDYGFIPYLSERDRLGNLILPHKEKERREQLMKLQEQQHQKKKVTQTQSNFRKERLQERQSLNLVKNNSQHFSKPATATDLAYNSQQSLQSEPYDKSKHKQILTNQQRQQKNNPNSLLKALKPDFQESMLEKSNSTMFEKTKSVWDNLNTHYNKIDYNQKNAWVNNLYVSDKAHIPGTNRITMLKKNPKLENEDKLNQSSSSSSQILKPSTAQTTGTCSTTRKKLINKAQYPCIGYYSNTDNVFKYPNSPKISFRKDKGIEKIKQSMCTEDYYDINDNMLKNKETRIYVADLERGGADRFNSKVSGNNRQNRKKMQIDPQEIDERMEFLRNMSKKYQLGTFTQPVNYRLQWDISKRPTMEDMLNVWNGKIANYGISLGRKGMNKLFSSNMEIKNKEKKKK